MHEQQYQYVGFWERTLAAIVDSIFIMLATIPLLVSVYGWAYLDTISAGASSGVADILITWVLPPLAIIAFWLIKQATPGKMMVSAKIVDAKTGEPPSTGQCVLRYLGYYLSMLPLFLGIIWVGIDKRKQGWHDKLAGTLVVKVIKK